MPVAGETLTADDLHDAWLALSLDERSEGFQLLSRSDAEEVFEGLSSRDQAALLGVLPAKERRLWLRSLPPDDTADLLQEAPREEREALLSLLDDPTRVEVQGLLAYAEDVAGGLMSPRFARARPDMRADEAIAYLRRQARGDVETVYYVYVLDASQRLLGVVSFRQLFAARPHTLIEELMERDLRTVREGTDQEEVSRLVSDSDLLAVPVLDALGRMRGVITVDDVVDVVEEEATEDVQLIGGSEPLDMPYLEASIWRVLRKRGGWLVVLLLGQMLTATAMGRFQDELASAVVLALFIPLVISSGGNSGSQASTLVIRSLTTGEARLADWWRVLRRELLIGALLGGLLGVIGFARVALWDATFHSYGEHAPRVAVIVGVSLLGVVLWGSLTGAMLPFLLRRLKLDPASASAPLVATIIDVTGIVLYFSLASFVLRGAL